MGGAAGRPDRGRLRSGHYKATSLFGVGAPKATPVGIIGRLNKEINAALVDPKMRVRLADLGGTVLACSPADFGKLIAEETEKWGQVLSVYRAQASLGLPPRGTPPWRLQSTIATSSTSTASYGGFAPVRRGAMCRKSTGNGTQFTDASGAGAPAVCGRAGWGEITCSQPIR